MTGESVDQLRALPRQRDRPADGWNLDLLFGNPAKAVDRHLAAQRAVVVQFEELVPPHRDAQLDRQAEVAAAERNPLEHLHPKNLAG